MIIYIDADACPVKSETYRVAKRFKLKVVLVANSQMRIPDADWVTLVQVEKKWDAADNWIADEVVANDVVITNDILLAERCIKEKKAHPITPDGTLYSMNNIGEALARRELASRLREWGGPESGPPPFTKGDRSRFLQTLHLTVERIHNEIEPR